MKVKVLWKMIKRKQKKITATYVIELLRPEYNRRVLALVLYWTSTREERAIGYKKKKAPITITKIVFLKYLCRDQKRRFTKNGWWNQNL